MSVILPVGGIASYVELYTRADDAHAHGVLDTGVTQLQLDLYQLSDKFLNLRHEDFFVFIGDGFSTGRA